MNSSSEEIVIRPSVGWHAINLAELWRHRELLYFLAWRDIKLRYKQTVMGAVWVIIQPLSMMFVLTIVFGRLGAYQSTHVPYSVFAIGGLVPWFCFAAALSGSANSLVTEGALISKVYFPRLIVPFATVAGVGLDFFFGLGLIFTLMLFYGYTPAWTAIFAPLFVFVILITAMSIGLWIAALNVKYRDFRYIIPFGLQLAFFLTPVVYQTSAVPPNLQWLYWLNPMVAIIECFRWTLTGYGTVHAQLLAVSFSMIVLLFVGGVYFFRRAERTAPDLV